MEKFSKEWYIDKAGKLQGRVLGIGNFSAFVRGDEARKSNKYKRWFSDEFEVEDLVSFYPKGDRSREWEKVTFKDIMSPKVNAFVSIEQKRPFEYTLVAVNEGAHSRREEEEFSRYFEYFKNQSILPIEQQLAMEAAQATQGRQLTPEEAQQVQQQIQQKLEAASPPETKRFMQRKYQDVADIAGNQALNFLLRKTDFKRKLDDGLLEAALTQNEIYWLYDINGHPEFEMMNGDKLYYLLDPASPFIEKSHVIIAEHWWSLERIAMHFPEDLTDEELEELKSEDFGFVWNATVHEANLYPVYHILWRERRKAFRVKFKDKSGEEVIEYHDESFKSDKDGDEVEVVKIYIDQIHECWRVGHDKYVKYGPLEDQFLDPDVESPDMPYYGARHKSHFCRKMDVYVSLYSIMWYRYERLLARNKGKKTFINPGGISKAGGLGIEKFMHYFEEHDIGFMETKGEGNRGNMADIVNLVKEIDLSNNGDMMVYLKLLEYLDTKCGEVVSIPKQLEAQIQEREAVSNVNQVVNFSVGILEPYYALHDSVKKNVMAALLDKARVVWQRTPPRYLEFVLDDMSLNFIKFNKEHFCNSKYGLFINNPSQVFEVKQSIDLLLARYIQNPNANINYALRVKRSTNLAEAQEYLEIADQEQKEFQSKMATVAGEQANQLEDKKQQNKREEWKHEEDMLNLKEGWRQETELLSKAIVAMGFDPTKDVNENDIPDVIEQAKLALKEREAMLDEVLANHKMKHDNKKLELEKERIKKISSKSK